MVPGIAGCKYKAATVFRGGNFLSGPTIFQFQAWDQIKIKSFGRISHFQVCPWHFQVFRMMDYFLGFKDGGLQLGFSGFLDRGSSGYGLKYGSYGLDLDFQGSIGC
jgi:hypothetical protein